MRQYSLCGLGRTKTRPTYFLYLQTIDPILAQLQTSAYFESHRRFPNKFLPILKKQHCTKGQRNIDIHRACRQY